MPLRIFVHVVGFTDTERHALNSVFRLSEERETRYSLWMPGAPEAAQLALVDGHSDMAGEWLAGVPAGHTGELFWVGQVAPAHAAKVFDRPLYWPDVVFAMDAHFAPPAELDFDLDFGAKPPGPEARRALVLDADRDFRLYFRAKLASAGIYAMDEATGSDQALALLAEHRYDLLVIDAELMGDSMTVWSFLARIGELKPNVPMVLLVAAGRPILTRIKAWFAGAHDVLSRPPHPGKLLRLLRKT